MKSQARHWIFSLFPPQDAGIWLSNAVAGGAIFSHSSWSIPGIGRLIEHSAFGLAVSMVATGTFRGARMIRDANDRRFIERQQIEIREELRLRGAEMPANHEQ
jgi:hypothetical protein